MNASPFLSGPRIAVRGDPVRRGIQKYPPGHSALDAESRNTGRPIPVCDPSLDPASLCGVTHATGPRIAVRGDPVLDAVSRNTLPVIPHSHVIPRYDAVLHVIPHLMRNPGNTRAWNTSRPIPVCGTFLDPASLCGVTRCDAESRNTLPVIPHSHVIPRYDAVSRNTRHWTPHHSAG